MTDEERERHVVVETSRAARGGPSRGGPLFGPGGFAGLVIAVIGVLLLLREFGVLPDFDLSDFWPLILVFVGGSIMRRRAGGGGLFVGAVIALLGVGFLLDNLGMWDFDLGRFWPLILVALGLAMLWGAVSGGGPHGGHRRGTLLSGGKESERGDVVDRFVALGGAEIKCDSASFRGGRLSAVMGGIELDLRNATMAGEEAVLDTFALMGGIEVRVPEDWSVVGKVLPLLGGFEDGTHPGRESGKPTRRLVIHGTAVMGAVEVKN